MKKYRPEIDGLRTLAVLPVIFCHAGVSLFKGGYSGVDVFFVISGYLITSNILNELSEGKFSILNFYERRARRILPALFFVLIACIPVALLTMPNSLLREFGQSLLAVSAAASNVLFFLTSGYFDSASDEKPLLHTWSLSIEEQYYFIFPLLLIFLYKKSKGRISGVILTITILSFISCIWGYKNYSDGNYYLLPFRAWELLVGSLLSIFEFKNHDYKKHKWTETFFAMLGLGMVIWSALKFDKFTPWPSHYTLMPTLGTVLLLMFARSGNLVQRLLALKPLVFIGLISYSAYLWHQPMFAFMRIYSLDEQPLSVYLGLSIFSLVLAYLTWRFVEQPFRDRSKVSRKAILNFSVVGLSFTFIIGLSGHLFYDNSKDTKIGKLLADGPLKAIGLKDKEGRKCSGRRASEACVLKPEVTKKGVKSWVIIGDSHARMISEPLWKKLSAEGIPLIDLTWGGCFYAPGLMTLEKGIPTGCDLDYQEERRKYLLSLPPSIVLIHGRLPIYLSPDDVDNREGGIEKRDPVIFSEYPQTLTPQERLQLIKTTLTASIQELVDHGHSVILIYPVPEAGWHIPHRVNKLFSRFASLENVIKRTSFSFQVAKERLSESHLIFNAVKGTSIVRVHPEKYLCNVREPNRCHTVSEDYILYADANHLSQFGSSMLIEKVWQEFNLSINEKN